MPDVPTADRLTFRRLGLADAPELQLLFDRCAEFYVLTEGAPAMPDAAAQELVSSPPNKSVDDNLFFGIDRDGHLAGFVSVAKDFPKPDEWWIGLMLLDPDHRGHGLGAEAHEAVRRFALDHGVQRLWLGVLEQNTVGERFWRRMGYVERERQRWTAPSGLESPVILMALELGG